MNSSINRLAASLIAAVSFFGSASAQPAAPAPAALASGPTISAELSDYRQAPICEVRCRFDLTVSDLQLADCGAKISSCIGEAKGKAGKGEWVWLQWKGSADVVRFAGEGPNRNNISQAALASARVAGMTRIAEMLEVPWQNQSMVIVREATEGSGRSISLAAFAGPPVRWRLAPDQATAVAAVPGLEKRITAIENRPAPPPPPSSAPPLVIRPWGEIGVLAGTVASPSIGGGPVVRLGVSVRAGDWALRLGGGAGQFGRLALEGRLLLDRQLGRSSVALGLGTYLFDPTSRGSKTIDGGTAWTQTGYAQSRIHAVGEYGLRLNPQARLPLQVTISGAVGPGESGLVADQYTTFTWWTVGLGIRATWP